MHETSARTWCTGKTQRDQAERELGVGIGMENTCKTMADSCQCMTKSLQYCKVISLQLIKNNNNNNKWMILERRWAYILVFPCKYMEWVFKSNVSVFMIHGGHFILKILLNKCVYYKQKSSSSTFFSRCC